jgi:hypothetical protein
MVSVVCTEQPLGLGLYRGLGGKGLPSGATSFEVVLASTDVSSTCYTSIDTLERLLHVSVWMAALQWRDGSISQHKRWQWHNRPEALLPRIQEDPALITIQWGRAAA